MSWLFYSSTSLGDLALANKTFKNPEKSIIEFFSTFIIYLGTATPRFFPESIMQHTIQLQNSL